MMEIRTKFVSLCCQKLFRENFTINYSLGKKRSSGTVGAWVEYVEQTLDFSSSCSASRVISHCAPHLLDRHGLDAYVSEGGYQR